MDARRARHKRIRDERLNIMIDGIAAVTVVVIFLLFLITIVTTVIYYRTDDDDDDDGGVYRIETIGPDGTQNADDRDGRACAYTANDERRRRP